MKIYFLFPICLVLLREGLSAEVIKTSGAKNVTLVLELSVYENNILRLRLKEKNPLKPRYEVPDVLLPTLKTAQATYKDHRLSFGPGAALSAAIGSEPFRLDVFSGSGKLISMNDRSLLKFEELRERSEAATTQPQQHTAEEDDLDDEDDEGKLGG